MQLTLKKFSVAAKPALNPVDFKFAPVVSSFTLLTCSVNLDLDAAVSEVRTVSHGPGSCVFS